MMKALKVHILENNSEFNISKIITQKSRTIFYNDCSTFFIYLLYLGSLNY